MEITIKSSNGKSYSVQVDALSAFGAPTRISDVLSNADVLSMFDKARDEVVGAFSELNGSPFPAALRDIVAASAIAEGMVLGIDLPAVRDNVAVAPRQGDGQPGVVMVNVDGGMVAVRLSIINGQYSVYEAMHNDKVKAETGYDDTRLSACSVMVNNVTVAQERLNEVMLRDGDSVVLSPNTACDKG